MNHRRVLAFLRFTVVAAALVLPLLCVVAAPRPSAAHGDAMWIQRGAYYIIGSNPRVHCCGVSDCHRLRRDEVMVLGNRFKIGSARLGLYADWPADKTYASENEDFWVCFSGGAIRCFFAPSGM